MEAGDRFILLAGDDGAGGAVEPCPVLLSYQPPSASEPMGRFHWVDSSHPPSSPSSSVSVAALTDVFLGLQSPAFRALPPSFPAPFPDCCASLVFSLPLQLDLIAQDEATLNRWLAGLNRILDRGGRGCVVEEEGVREEAQRSTESGEASAAAEEAVDGVAAVAAMRLGCAFDRFSAGPQDGEARVERLRLRFDDGEGGGLGRLCSPTSSLPLSSLTDVLVGQHTRTFSLPPASSAPPSLCVSLLSTEGQWDLQAASEAALSTWLAGIHHVLTTAAEVQLSDEAEEAAEATEVSAPPPSARPAVRPSFHVVDAVQSRSATSAAVTSPLVASLVAGEWFDLRKPASSAPRRVLVFLQPAASRMGCLYYTGGEGGREERLQHSLALHTLSDVWVGAKAAEAGGWRTGKGEDGLERHCLSLISRREKSSLHLQAVGGERVVRQWVRGIAGLLHTLGATIGGGSGQQATTAERPPAGAPLQPSLTPPSPAPPLSSPASLPPGLLQLLEPLLSPTPMSLLTNAACYPVSLQLSSVTASASALLSYRHLSPEMATTPAKRLSVRRVTDLYLGFSSPSLRQSGWADGAKLNAARVWSLCTRKATWDLCATSEEDRGRWVSALRELIVHMTRKRVVDDADDEEAGGAKVEQRPPQSSTAPVAPSAAGRRMSFQPAKAKAEVGEGAKALAQLTRGLPFTRYEAVDGLTFKQPVLLFYRQRRERGRVEEVLYWADDSPAQSRGGERGPPPLLPSQSLAIDRISDIFLGKQTPQLSSPSASSAADDHCIALVSPSLALELEASQPSTASALLAALQFICEDGGRQMAEEKVEEVAVGSAAADAEAGRLKASQLQMLAKKGSRGRRFSLGPALQSGVHRRLSCLSSRLSMMATQEEGDSTLSLPKGASMAAVVEGGGDCLAEWIAAAGDCASSAQALLQDGRVFTGYTADSRGRYHQSTLLLFLSTAPPTLHWCPYGVKQMHANASLPLSSLQSVVLGKSTPALQSLLAKDAREDRCLALQSAERSIELEGKDERTLLALLLGVQAALQTEGRRLRGEAREGGGRRFAVKAAEPPPPVGLPSPPPRPAQLRAAAPLSSPPQPTPSLRTGRSFELLALQSQAELAPSPSALQPQSSPSAPALTRRPIVLSFEGGSLHWTAPDAPPQSSPSSAPSSLALRAIRDIYCGPTTPTMRRAAELRAAPVERCVSLVGRGVELNLLAASQADARSLVAELMALLTSSGKVVCEEKGKGAQMPSIAPPTPAAPSTPPPLPHRPAALKAGGTPASRANKENQSAAAAPPASSQPTSRRISVVGSSGRRTSARSSSPQTLQLLQRMVDGRRFLHHTAGEQGSAARPVLLSYQAASHSLAVHPFPASGRVASSSSPPLSLPLRLLTEVVTGKQTAVFLSPACQAVDRSRCVCLVSGAGSRALQLHLEADSAAALTGWLKDLQALLALQGKLVVVEGGGAAAKAVGMDAAAARRFSVVHAAHNTKTAPALRAGAGSATGASGSSRQHTQKATAAVK